MFVRFVVGTDSENAAWLTGVITAASLQSDEGNLSADESAHLEQIFAWFNAHLPCPPIQKNLRAGTWTRDAVCWFRHQAAEPIARIWDLVALLKEHDVPVRMVRTRKPGKILYEDAYQVVAETPYWA